MDIISISTHDEDEKSEGHSQNEKIRICLVGDSATCEKTKKAAYELNVPIIFSETGSEYLFDTEWKTYFVLTDFSGDIFNILSKSRQRVLGPPALWHLSDSKDGFPDTIRAIYNYSMKGVITCFTGIRKKDELTKLVNMIHFMGGSIRRDMNSKVTHLICKNSGGEKYQYAMTFRLNVVRTSWVYESWSNRNEYNFNAKSCEFSKMHFLKPFEGYKLCFFGFSPDENEHMVEILQGNGGTFTNLEDPECTHVIMANTGGYFPENISPPLSPILVNTCENDISMENVNESGLITESSEFINTQNLSPISSNESVEEQVNFLKDLKRKRDVDNQSLISNDSIACVPSNKAKKPKLLRTGSISRSIKRSMSFVATRTPLAGVIRHRRNSVDPNASISSITSISSTLNTSIRIPVKEKFKSFRNSLTPNRRKSPKKEVNSVIFDTVDFKTPKAPRSKSFSIYKIKTFNPSPCIGDGIDFNNPPVNLNSTPINIDLSYSTTNIQPLISSINECDISLNHINEGNLNMVVDEHFTQIKPEPKNKKTHIVRSDWFWYTIQNGYANECDFQFGDYLDSIANTSCSDAKDSLPISCNKRKRKILQRKQGDGTPLIVTKRRSSVSDAGLLSVSGSFLDFTSSPDKSKNVIDIECESRLSVASMRFNHFMDYYTTESNYVGILETINTVFKIPLENRADSDDYLLTKSEVKTIFGNFASIHNVHKEMLNRLNEIKMNWKEDLLIGQIILDFRDELLRAYPPYVNYFETMKESLQHCDNQNPRFHAFLKINQAKSECGRQTLQDLMIRPVQRLPSISLLLNDILKYTCKSSPDHKILEEALSALKEVMKFINEDKRKTESQMAIFNIHKEIDGCPPDLISSHRNFIRKCEVTELSDCLSRKGDCLVFYLFSDTIEICKKRSSGGYKHVYLMSLSSIRLIINIADNSRAFSIHCRNGVDSQDFLYSFLINDEENEKIIFLKCLSKQIAENACTMDFEKQMTTMSSHDVGIDIKDANIVAKAFKLVARTRQKVERTFSFNKTPSKLKRAVSTMMTSPFGSTNNLTPSTQLAQMKLASCTNINEVSEDDEKPCLQTKDDLLMAPLSTQPSRRTKTLTLNNLRRI